MLALNPAALVIRTSAFFGPWDRNNFLTVALDAIGAGRRFARRRTSRCRRPIVPDLVNVSLDLLIDGAQGIWHLANAGAVTWAEFAVRAARAAGMDESAIEGCDTRKMGLAALRPPYSVLATERGQLLPALDDSLERYLRDREVFDTTAA